MKVALCNVQEFNPMIGGIERVSVSLAGELLKQGIDVAFISCRKSPYGKEYELPAVQYTLPSEKDYDERNVEAMVDLVRKENIDIIVNQNAHSMAFHRQCAKVRELTGARLVSVLHFDPEMRVKSYKHQTGRFFSLRENIKNSIYSLLLSRPFTVFTLKDQKNLYRALYRDSDMTVLLSGKYLGSFLKISGLKDGKKITAIPNMLSFPYSEEKNDKKNVLLFCGRMAPQKNPYRALYVWERIQHRLPGWQMKFVGGGPWLQRMQDLAEKKKLERCKFTGFDNPVEYYKEAKIFLMTSGYEGWPLTLMESMQYGCIPVAFNSYASITDIVSDGSDGFLIPPFDIDRMAEKVLEAAESEALAAMSDRAVRSMSRFKPETVAGRWKELFAKIK